jgi:hypothetical protein
MTLASRKPGLATNEMFEVMSIAARTSSAQETLDTRRGIKPGQRPKPDRRVRADTIDGAAARNVATVVRMLLVNGSALQSLARPAVPRR